MSVEVKILTLEPPTQDTSSASSINFNSIPTSTGAEVYDLYVVGANKTAIVKSLRFVNTHTADVELTVYLMRPDGSSDHQRVLLTPEDMTLTPGFVYVDEAEITLEADDRIQAKASVDKKIQYLISGVEREVV